MDTVTISKEEYGELWEARAFLRCLEATGVDNWEGYGIAQDRYDEKYGDNEEETNDCKRFNR